MIVIPFKIKWIPGLFDICGIILVFTGIVDQSIGAGGVLGGLICIALGVLFHFLLKIRWATWLFYIPGGFAALVGILDAVLEDNEFNDIWAILGGLLLIALGFLFRYLQSERFSRFPQKQSRRKSKQRNTRPDQNPPPVQRTNATPTQTNPRFCPACGAHADSGASFCTNCGKKLT